jgi:hypothetical protein
MIAFDWQLNPPLSLFKKGGRFVFDFQTGRSGLPFAQEARKNIPLLETGARGDFWIRLPWQRT